MHNEVKHIIFNHTDCGVPFLVNSGKAHFLAPYIQSNSLHTTNFFELYFFATDAGHIEVDGVRIALEANTILFLSPAHHRRWQVTHMDFDFLLFVEDFLSTFMKDHCFVHRLQYFYQYVHPLVLPLSSTDSHYIEHLMHEAQTELRHINRNTEPLLTALLSYLLLRLNRLYCEANGLPEISETDTLATRFKRLLETHVTQQQYAEFYATELGVSRVTLDKAVKAQYGDTASELIKRRLLIDIKNALRYEDKSIKEVAYAMGFSEPNHMMRFFKRLTGETISTFLTSFKSGSIQHENDTALT